MYRDPQRQHIGLRHTLAYYNSIWTGASVAIKCQFLNIVFSNSIITVQYQVSNNKFNNNKNMKGNSYHKGITGIKDFKVSHLARKIFSHLVDETQSLSSTVNRFCLLDSLIYIMQIYNY